jgi:hypothetical protein
MPAFPFLRQYVNNTSGDVSGVKHTLMSVTAEDMPFFEDVVVPAELMTLYKEIGYGFFHVSEENGFMRIPEPFSYRSVNLREDEYKDNPDMDLFDELYEDEKVLFMELSEGVWLGIDKKDVNGKNAVYFFETKMNDSLVEFLRMLDRDPLYITQFKSEYVEEIDDDWDDDEEE